MQYGSYSSNPGGAFPCGTAMVNVKKGVLITCDPAMKQLLVHMDETRHLGSKFIVKELDETHLFVDKDIEEVLERKMDEIMENMNPENTER